MAKTVYEKFQQLERSLKQILNWEKIQLNDIKHEKEYTEKLDRIKKILQRMKKDLANNPSLKKTIIKYNIEIKEIGDKLLFREDQLNKDFKKLTNTYRELMHELQEINTPLPNLTFLISEFSERLISLENKLETLFKQMSNEDIAELKQDINQLKEFEEIYFEEVHKELKQTKIIRKEIKSEKKKAKHKLDDENNVIYTLKFSKHAKHNLKNKTLKMEFIEDFKDFIKTAMLIKQNKISSSKAIKTINYNLFDVRRGNGNRYIFTLDASTRIVKFHEIYSSSQKEMYNDLSTKISNRQYEVPSCDHEIDFY